MIHAPARTADPAFEKKMSRLRHRVNACRQIREVRPGEADDPATCRQRRA
jgi:hypothetical protein